MRTWTAGVVALACLCVGDADAQSSRIVRFVVPFPAGGGADLLTRIISEQISKASGVTSVIENRPGAASVIGTEAVSRANPDGNTVLIAANSFVIQSNFKKLSYDPLVSFEPVCVVAISPQVIVVNATAPYKTLAELFGAARAQPGILTNASVGPGAAQQVAFEQLKLLAGVKMSYIPFNGNGPALNSLMGGHVTAVMANYAEAAELIKSGKLRPLAVASKARAAWLPDVPTVAESGFPNYEVNVWYVMLAPAKTPRDKVAELARWCSAAATAPDVTPKLDLQGLTPIGSSPADTAAMLKKDSEDYARTIRETGIQSSD